MFGIVGAASVWLLSAALALVLGLLSLGLSRSEWRSAGHAAGVAARFSVSAGGGAVGALSRGAGGVGNASGWLVNLVSRGPGLEPDEPPAPAVRPRPAVRQAMAEEARPSEAAFAPAPAPASGGDANPRSQTGRHVDAQAAAAEPAVAGRRVEFPVVGPAEAASAGGRPRVRARRPCRRKRGCWRRCCRITVYRAKSWRSARARVVTLYELVPAPGIRSARVIGLADDVARSLSVTAVRIATVPGRNVIGIEVPNSKRETVFLSEILSSDEVTKASGRLSLGAGQGHQRQGDRC